jgi:hypothetical protein
MTLVSAKARLIAVACVAAASTFLCARAASADETPHAEQHAQPPAEPHAEPHAAQRAEEHAATVHDRASPLTFRVARGALDARRRANDAGSALRSALEEPVDAAAAAEVRVQGSEATVIVLGRTITTLTEADAAAAGTSLPQYAAELETRLVSFVDEEQQRSTLQGVALRVFLTVLFAVLGLLTLRALRSAFLRWETAAETTAPSPIQLVGVPVLSSDARKALTAVALMVARWCAYAAVVVIAVAASLSQFEATRPWLKRGASAVVDPVWHGVDTLIRALPGILLAVLLVVVLQAALEFLRLLLEGVAQGRVTSRLVAPERARPARMIVTTAAVLVVAPLVAAAAFGRFGAPLEDLAIAAGVCALVAAVPAGAAAVVGVSCLWRGNLKPGDWISIGKVEGEVASVGLIDFVIVPEQGGTVAVPMLSLLLRPTLRKPGHPRAELDVSVQRDRSFDKIIDALTTVARTVDESGTASLLGARGDVIDCRLRVALGKGDARDALVRALLASVERGDVVLADAAAQRAQS